MNNTFLNPKLEELQNFLSENFDFRYNVLTDMPECKPKNTTTYRMIDKRMMNSLSYKAMMLGIECKDTDVKRFLFSDQIVTHHPFKDYIDGLPEWDGTDRVTMLAARVSGNGMWLNGFHRWMLGMVAQWLGYPSRCANALAPILISTEQGMCKSTFCSILLPEELRAYYTDKFAITSTSGCEQKISTFGLINMDEFDQYNERMMTILKNLMQMKKVNYRKCFKAYYSDLPRIASFIGTSNEKSLLTDGTGSRRFLCIEVEKPIDCSPIDYTQLYAQLNHELEAGKRYWLTKEEELEIQEHNRAFYRHSPEEEAFYKIFTLPKENDSYLKLTATDIFNTLQKRFPKVMQGIKPQRIGNIMTRVGAKKMHTRQGNVYLVKPVKLGETTQVSPKNNENQSHNAA
ncbi:MAG: helicase [Bacteroides sp.]|nr:helicase [Bacteroides sp.]